MAWNKGRKVFNVDGGEIMQKHNQENTVIKGIAWHFGKLRILEIYVGKAKIVQSWLLTKLYFFGWAFHGLFCLYFRVFKT